MASTLYKILLVILAADLFACGILIVFLINARINLKRQIHYKNFFVKTCQTAQTAKSSEEAAQFLHITPEEFRNFCEQNAIETPEVRRKKTEEQENAKKAEEKRILEEEAAWRAEQEKLAEERQKVLDEETRKRKSRLNKFGFR